MYKIFRTALVLAVLMANFILIPFASAEAPKPEKGVALGTIAYDCKELFADKITKVTFDVRIEFQNVGKSAGDDYKRMNLKLSREATNSCADGGREISAIFDGGPNGTIDTGDANNENWRMQMVEGRHISLIWWGKTSDIPIQNPEVFSKYDWNEKSTESELEDSGVSFSNVFGQVEVSIPRPDGTFDEESWDLVTFKEYFDKKKVLPVGTHIKAGENSGGIISFSDMTTFTLKPETEIVLTSPSSENSEIKILWGNLKANVKKLLKDGSLEVEMSQAVAGIKGTIFTLEDRDGKSTLRVMEGLVSFRSKANGKVEMVGVGETITADKDGLGEKTKFDVGAEDKGWEDFDKKFITANKSYLTYIVIGIILLLMIGIFALKKMRKQQGQNTLE